MKREAGLGSPQRKPREFCASIRLSKQTGFQEGRIPKDVQERKSFQRLHKRIPSEISHGVKFSS